MELCFVENPRVTGRLSMPGGKSPRHTQNLLYWTSEGKHSQQPTMAYHPTLTSSSVHHSSHQWTALFLLYYNIS